MTHNETYNKILSFLQKSQFEETQRIYMKEPLVVGSNPNGDVLCTYISSTKSEPGFYLNVLFDKHDDDLYGTDFEFAFIGFYNSKRFSYKPVSEENKKNKIVLNKTVLKEILNSLETWGDEWNSYQRELSIKSRHYHRLAVSNTPIEFTWEDKLNKLRVGAETNELSWTKMRKNFDTKQLNEMIKLGEEKWNEKMKRQSELMKPILDKIIKKNDWLK
jgi:hypothetical protein